MKSYRWFIAIFSLLLVIYIIAEINRPKPVNWEVTLSKDDKNPYGSYVLFNSLKDVFPTSVITSLREPAYNLLHDEEVSNAAYIIVAPFFRAGETDVKELIRFAERGNSVFFSAGRTTKLLMDTLGLKIEYDVQFLKEDSTAVNMVNPLLKADTNYGFKRYTIDEHFGKFIKPDSTTVLGINQSNNPNFVKVQTGKGAFFVHSAPLCFSNYFMLTRNNHKYVSKALSYIPENTGTIYWDEYYKLGRTGPTTPLRFFLSNTWLRWALRLAIIGMLVYIFFEMKRRQRIIPVIDPLRNTTVDFVKTVSAVYLSQKDNKGIAVNKIQYWLQYIRQRYYLQTARLDSEFVTLLSKKSGVSEENINLILVLIDNVQNQPRVSDNLLLQLNQQVDKFYTTSKT
jgi:hypothetical protein